MTMLNQKTSTHSRWHIDRWLWQRCSARETLLGFLALVGVALVLGYVFPQTPVQVRADPVSYQQWLSSIQVRFKTWTPLLDALGMFYVQDTTWFRILVALSAFVLLISTASHINTLREARTIRKPERFYDSSDAINITSPLSPEQVVPAVKETIGALLGRVQVDADGSTTYLYSSRAAWAGSIICVLYAGLLMTMVGLAINGRWGWQQPNVQLLPQVPVSVGPDGSRQIELANAPKASTEVVLLTEKGERVSLPQGRTRRRGSYSYQLAAEGGPLVRISAQRDNGAALTLYDYAVHPQPVEQLVFTFSPAVPGEGMDRLFIVSEEKVVARLQWLDESSAQVDGGQRFHLWVFREDGQTLLGEQEIQADGDAIAVTIGGITYALDISRFFVVNVAYLPGLWILRVGTALAGAGLLAHLLPRQQIWGTVFAQGNATVAQIRFWSRGYAHRFRQAREEALARLHNQIEEMEER